jgi:glycosyltransferase involved in cell wall biosynthesis
MERFDIVLGHSIPFSTSILATKHAREHGKPVMILPHFHMDDEFYHWKSYYEALRGATAVLASPLRSIDLFFHKIGAKARYLPGGIDPAEHENVDAADFLSLYRGTLPFFLVLGRKSGSKHYHWVIDAVRDINRNKPVCSLVLIGKDEDGERIDARDTIYLGERDRNVVLGALKECTALISMSESESFGIVILEAWIHKKPVIVNEQCAAFTELVEDGLDGLLANRVTLADKLGAVLQNPLKAREMGARGCEKVTEKFTWASIGKELNQLLRTISAKGA